MRRVVLMVVLAVALALPTAVWADSVLDYTNVSGNISVSDSGLSITSTLAVISVPGGAILQTGNLGTVSITTGALSSGTIAGGGAFGAGTLTITSTGGTVLFSGSFDSATWSASGTVGSNLAYTLFINFGNGTSTQMALFTTTPLGSGSTGVIASGDTTVAVVVPEPGTMGLLGTGLVGIAGLVRRKLKV